MFKKIMLIVGLLISFMLIPALIGLAKNRLSVQTSNVTKIAVYNPYSLEVSLELKCDYRKDKFIYHRFILVPAKNNIIIVVPNSLKECQIWPHIIFW